MNVESSRRLHSQRQPTESRRAFTSILNTHERSSFTVLMDQQELRPPESFFTADPSSPSKDAPMRSENFAFKI